MTTWKKEDLRQMKREIRRALTGYESRYISRATIEERLQENGTRFAQMQAIHRRRLITKTMREIGWGSFNGEKQKSVRTYVRVQK